MPSGILGSASLAAATHATLYTVPAGRTATLVINACNRNATAVKLRLALAAGATPSANEWIERGFYDLDVSITGENNDQFKVTVKSTYLHDVAGFLDLPLICTYCLFVYDNNANIIGKYVFSIRVTKKT